LDFLSGHCFDGAGDVFSGKCNDSARVIIKQIPLDALDITYDPSRAENSEEFTRTLVHAKSPDKGQLLREDIRLMRLLRHPHIVDFHACFVDGPSIYLVLGGCNYGLYLCLVFGLTAASGEGGVLSVLIIFNVHFCLDM
ncbi:hypothetical protein COOONC_00466, partial [Cooperia oncophora]